MGLGRVRQRESCCPEELGLEVYLNADEIARSISPQNVDAAAFQAGRVMLERMRELVRSGASFAFETTCAGRSYLRLLKEWQAEGWRVVLLYLWLPSADHSVWRSECARVGMGFRKKRFGAGILLACGM